MPLCRCANDEECCFNVGDQFIFQDDGEHYVIVNRLKMCVGECECYYQCLSCSPNNTTRKIQINVKDEYKIEKVTCKEVIEKFIEDQVYENKNQFMNLILKNISKLCSDSTMKHKINFDVIDNQFVLTLDDMKFYKNLNN